MLSQMSLAVQRAWLARAVSMLQPNDQMFSPEPQALVRVLTQLACADAAIEHSHAANLARYWTHGLRFTEHSPTALSNIQALLGQDHTHTMMETELDALLANETQAPRMLRLWLLLKDTVSGECLLPHMERVLFQPLPIGKKRKLSQIDPDQWPMWLAQQEKLSPEAFNMGLFLYMLTNLTTRQDTPAQTRCANAWAMLLTCAPHLAGVLKKDNPAQTSLSPPLRALVEHADSETIANMPWSEIQTYYATAPHEMHLVWKHMFDQHKTMLLGMLPTIDTQYHPAIRQWFMDLENYPLEEERAAPLLRLIAHDAQWGVLLDKMLQERHGRRKLGDYLLSSWNQLNGHSLPTTQFPSQYMQVWTTKQWEDTLKLSKPEHVDFPQLCGMWQLVREHKLKHLAASHVLQKITLHILQNDLEVPTKVRPWDTNLNLPAFYRELMSIYMAPEQQAAWFTDWTTAPSSEALVRQTFSWFNPDIAVPPLDELQLLTQTMGGTMLDMLHHLKKANDKIDTLDLPNMLQ